MIQQTNNLRIKRYMDMIKRGIITYNQAVVLINK